LHHSFSNIGDRWRWVVKTTPQPLNPLIAELNPICLLLALLGAHRILHVSGVRVNVRKRDAVPISGKAGWTSGPAWTGEEYLANTSIRSPDRRGFCKSLYKLRYLGPHLYVYKLMTG